MPSRKKSYDGRRSLRRWTKVRLNPPTHSLMVHRAQEGRREGGRNAPSGVCVRLVNSHDARDRDKIAGDVLSEGKNEDWLLALGA